ncbi:MAG: Gldg family protein [Pseudomonadota bacterium]|nr:Gldg family protein [Pseudomonadota bacterium]
MNQRFLNWSGIVLAAILFLAVNIVAGTTLRGSRLDLTDSGLFTLSEGTRNILGELPEPVTLRLYYSSTLAEGQPQIRNHANRVLGMLEEFQALAGGNIRLEVIDPEPFSEAEDRAVDAGLRGVPVGQGGETFYFGLVGENLTDDRQTIGFFTPERDRFLEYDLTRLVWSLAHPDKPKLTIITSLPLEFGPGGIQAAMRGQSQAYAILEPLRQSFEVTVPVQQWTAIDPDTDLLLVAHARRLTEAQLFQIDQFIMRGGKAVFLTDPLSEAAARQPGPGGAPNPGDPQDSLLPRLFDAWGIHVEAGKVVGDRTYATRVGLGGGNRRQSVDYVAWLRAHDAALNAADPVTADLSLPMLLASVGHVTRDADSPLTLTPLVTSSADSQLFDADTLRFRPDPEQMLASFAPDEATYVLAARLQGPVKSAFTAVPEGVEGELKAASDGPVNLIVVADADLIDDGFWVNRQQFLGQQVIQQTSSNAAFLLNALENLSGSSDLIGLRGRGESNRPFTVIEDLRREAEQRYLAEEQALTAKLSETEAKLAELQSKAGEGAGQLLSAEETEAIQSFQDEVLATRRELRAVQLGLRKDIEQLEYNLKLLNIGLVPALVCVLAGILALWRRARRRRSQNLGEA